MISLMRPCFTFAKTLRDIIIARRRHLFAIADSGGIIFDDDDVVLRPGGCFGERHVVVSKRADLRRRSLVLSGNWADTLLALYRGTSFRGLRLGKCLFVDAIFVSRGGWVRGPNFGSICISVDGYGSFRRRRDKYTRMPVFFRNP